MDTLKYGAPSPPADPAPVASRHRGPVFVAFILLVICSAAALSVDVVRSNFGGVKGDEAVYVSMALSAAYDGDLTYERRDLERFAGLFRSGPEGIFLKRGKVLQLRVHAPFPYVHLTRRADPRDDRLYFAKAMIYPIFAAPFVRAFGLNGLLLFNVLLLAGACACGYFFLAARSSPLLASTFTAAFVGASVLPVYLVFLTPEIFNYAVVFFAYFLWLYKAVAPSSAGQSSDEALFSHPWRDAAAAVLLGFATYSKLSNGLLIAPLVFVALARRRWARGIMIAAAFVATTSGWFLLNAAVSGEFNYQGGDRKTFYSAFPFDNAGGTWNQRGIGVITDGSAAESMLVPADIPPRFARNVEYFLVGRHFGFVPYCFPGAVAVLLWLVSPSRQDFWRIAIFVTFVVSSVVLLILLPYTWSGGGGPPGNRYLIGTYPTLFFLVPPLTQAWPVALAWIGGALFTAKMVVNPFVAAKYTYLATERGPARRLPVELTMANDLPVRLDTSLRARIPYGQDPTVLLYFLDQNAYTPDRGVGIWVSGSGRADILIRSVQPLDHLTILAQSPINTLFSISAGGNGTTVQIVKNHPITFDVPVSGVNDPQGFVCLLSARSSDAFIPHLLDPESSDFRNLGVLMQFRAVATAGPR